MTPKILTSLLMFSDLFPKKPFDIVSLDIEPGYPCAYRRGRPPRIILKATRKSVKELVLQSLQGIH